MNKIKILIADNQILIREGIRLILETHEDLKVIAEAENGEEAVKSAGIHKPDIIIIDVAMPRMNAVGTIRQIKSLYPGIGIMVLTALVDEQYVYSLLEAGADGYLLKNIHGRELIDGVRAIFAGVSVLDPSVARKVLNHFVPSPGKIHRQKAHDEISEREKEVIRLAVSGLPNKGIADVLKISGRTLQVHWSHIYNKLQVNSRSQAIVRSLKEGLVTLGDIPDSAA
jgi:two-component system, NarL family, response regulator LiaR